MKWRMVDGRGSNPRPLHCERSAFPSDLPPHEEGGIVMMPRRGSRASARSRSRRGRMAFGSRSRP